MSDEIVKMARELAERFAARALERGLVVESNVEFLDDFAEEITPQIERALAKFAAEREAAR